MAESERDAPFVFLSYSHEDREYVTRLREDLQAQGIDAWVDKEGIQAGTTDWEEALREAIQAAHAVLFIASPNARSSRYVKDELRIAEMYQRAVYPIWVAGNRWMEAVPIGLGGMQYIDAREARYQTALPEIVQTIHRTFKKATVSLPPSLPSDSEPRNPYKGLHAFRHEDARDFFGRSRLIQELLKSVQQMLATEQQGAASPRLLAVLGASGSGKSSVVMAGLLPQLQQGAIPGSSDWLSLDPMLPGKQPLEALTLTLSRHFPARSLTSISEDLRSDSARGLHLLMASLLKRPDMKAVLFIDQFEELFIQTSSEDERRHFLDLLLAAVTEPGGPVIAVLTLRADFYDRPLAYPEIGRLIEAHRLIMFPMDMKDFREVIEQPAQLPDVQLTFEDDLIGDLLFDIRGQSGALPLLQFTLDQLFQQRQGHLLTRQAYQELGGVKGALAQHAEATYLSLPSEEHRHLTRALFLRLIDAGSLEQDATRRRAPLSELILTDAKETALLQAVMTVFTTARLLTTNTITGIATVEVSHEALIREWTRLSNWLQEAYEDIRLQKKLSEDVAAWIHSGKPTDRLYRGSQLLESQAWRKRNIPSQDEESFLQACVAEREHQRRSQRRTVLIGLAGLGGVVATFTIGGYFLLPRPSLPPPIPLPFAYKSSGAINSVAWSPDSSRLASGSEDNTVQVWGAKTGKTLFIYKDHSGAINSVAWSPDGSRLASGSADNTVQVWEVKTGKTLFIYKGHSDAVRSVAWSPDGSRLASGSDDNTVQVWEAKTGKTLFIYKGSGAVRSVDWSPDGSRLASGSADNTVQVWEVKTGKTLFTYEGHSKTVYSVVWSPDSSRLASGSKDNTVQVWGAKTNVYIGAVESVAWSPDGSQLASGSADNTVQVWEVKTGKTLFIYKGHSDAVRSVAWSPDGSRLASGSADNTVQVWEAKTGKTLFTYKSSGAINSVAWSPDSSRLASGSDDNTVQVWEAKTGKTLFTYKSSGAINSVAWSPDGSWLASGNEDNTVQVWEAKTGKTLFIYKGHSNAVYSVAWSPDGSWLASGSVDKAVQIWEAKTGKTLFTYKSSGVVISVAWSPDGSRLASGSDDYTGQVWEAKTGKTLFIYKGHSGAINSVAWSPDGSRLASGSDDKTMQIWEAKTGKTLFIYKGHDASVHFVT